MNVHQADQTFNFDKLQLEHPVSMPGNSYFTSITMAGQPVYIETPQITTKQGFIKNVKKVVCDLLFSSNESDFIQWIETLETTCHSLVYKSSGDWFQDKLEYDDIENAFSPCMKSYKSGKYQACRCLIGVDHKNGNPLTKVYDETETPVPHTEVNEQSQIIGIIEIKGIRFTTRSFQIEIDLRQVMILKIDTVFDKCLIKKGGKPSEKTDKVDIISFPLPKYQKTSTKEEEQDEQDNKDVEDVHVEDVQMTVDENNIVNDEDHNENNLQLVEANNTNNNSSNADDSTVKDTNEQKDIPEPKLIEESIIEELKNDVQSVNNSLIATPTTIEKVDTLSENEDGLEAIDWDDMMLAPDNNDKNVISIKRPNQVYHEIYKKAKERARELKKQALAAILEANSLKSTYMLDDMDDDTSSVSEFDDEESIESIEGVQEIEN
tara:strand:+ start:399 stop:1703 length:1305 start_codon:yes stop_codon:yes gene_type:complete